MEYERTIRANIFTADHLTWREYVKGIAGNFIIIGICYRKLCFQALNGLSADVSKVLFFLLTAFVLMVEANLVTQRGKNTINSNVVAALVFGIYNIAAYFRVFTKLYICILTVALVLSILYLCAFLAERRKKRGRRTKRECLWQCFAAIRTIFAIGLIIPVIQLGVSAFLGHQLYIADRNITILQEEDEDDPDAWIRLFEEVDVMWEEEWEQLSLQEKLDKLQIVADFERVRAGIPFEIKVGAKVLAENVLSAYSPKDRSISIDFDTLEHYSGTETLHILMHETEHAVQATQVELYYDTEEKYKKLNIFRDAKIYANELVNYKDEGEAYEDQQVEKDAEYYAESTTTFYNLMYKSYRSGELEKLAETWAQSEGEGKR